MTVDGGQPIQGNDLTSFPPHTPNVSYGVVTNLQLDQHKVTISPGPPSTSKVSYILVRRFFILCLIANPVTSSIILCWRIGRTVVPHHRLL
jgi:hypothetical protein